MYSEINKILTEIYNYTEKNINDTSYPNTYINQKFENVIENIFLKYSTKINIKLDKNENIINFEKYNLDKNKLYFIKNPLGSQKPPDFYIIIHNEPLIQIECKSSIKDMKCMWNCSLPNKDIIYCFYNKKINKTILFLDIHIITEEEKKQLLILHENIKLIVSKQENFVNFSYYPRPMYNQKINLDILKRKDYLKDIYDKINIKKNINSNSNIDMDLINEFSKLSISLTKDLTKDIKKENGIFFTPKTIIHKLINYLKNEKLLDDIKYILEPSCGSCEIVNYLDNELNNVIIDSVEKNEVIYNQIKNLKFKNNINIYNEDFIKFETDKKYSLIIGNPPYFVMAKNLIPKYYHQFFTGRCNIFLIFIIKSINLLCDNGILAFIIPKSFLNSSYYSLTRNYINKTCSIIKVIDFEEDNKFIDTTQATFGLIIKKELNTTTIINKICNYSLILNNNIIITENKSKLLKLLENSTTIKNIGLFVKTGTIVWNQHKEKLTDNETKTLLIYNSNIKDNSFTLLNTKNEEKKQYIDIEGNNKNIIVVNRGNGNSNYKLNYLLLNDYNNYLVENHLNIIYSKNNNGDLLYKKIIKSFEDERTLEFIKIFFGNNSISKSELETILPIYL